MVKQTIQIFCRVKPTKAKAAVYEIDDNESGDILNIVCPKELSEGVINNKKEQFKFRFENIFDQQARQEDVFEHVAKPVIDNVLQGYNGTIFAYGQTGSGKTYTITGGAEKYADRGIIPRILSYVFDYYKTNADNVYTTYISYLEIYNESGYDLLDPKHEASKLEDLPKVSLMEDNEQNIHLKNLSTHTATSEEEALNLLFLGDTNRMIAETPMNQASTRSHCIFTVHISSREAGSATIRRAKLHLVDLAGSERVSKTGVNGTLLTEAKYINLSLHYLEQVIVSLSEKSRQHIPYRNSMMTSVLRDSLGGNCMTTMIATCSIERKNIMESISTCRFAQRVALIKNDALLNEELDPKLMIAKLKRDIQQLKEELSMATGQQRTDELTEDDIQRCEKLVNVYMEDNSPECVLDVGADMRKIQYCYQIMKKKIFDGKSFSPTATQPSVDNASDPVTEQEMTKMKELLIQRDNEINILVNMLKKEKKRAAEAEKISHHDATVNVGHREEMNELPHGRSNNVTNSASSESSRSSRKHAQSPASSKQNGHQDEERKHKILGDMSLGRQEAFEIFRRDYPQQQTIEDHKRALKQRYIEAKSLGQQVNGARDKINKTKSAIEQHRMSLVMQGLVDPQNPEADETELMMREQIEKHKEIYKLHFNKLRVLKTEIEHMQHLLEKSKVKLLKDFEIWWAEQAAVAQEKNEALRQLPPGNVKSAWKTPPLSPSVRSTAQSSRSSLASESISSFRSNSADRPYQGAPIPAAIKHSLTNNQGLPASYSDSSLTTLPRGQPSTGSTPGDIALTGDAQADADIMAFLKARQNIQNIAQSKGSR